MNAAAAFRDLVSGRRRGVGASLMRMALRVAEAPYTWVVRWRNRQFDTGRRPVHEVAVPVVSVGNLTLGGTGKTPMVHWLADWLGRRKLRVALVSRGYGVRSRQPNDEALQLAQSLPDVPHLQNPNRVQAARRAVTEFECQVILLDDAFQHRHIGRDLDIVMVDALEPFGFEHVFPRGQLREPLAGLARADVVALSRADLVDLAQRRKIHDCIQRYAAGALWVELTHMPQALLSATGVRAAIDQFIGRRVAAFCGIGNPGAFRQTLEKCGYDVVALREFPDHHPFRPAQLDQLGRWVADQRDVEAVICTHKDLVKVGTAQLGDVPLWALAVRLGFLSGQPELEQRLERLVAGTSDS